MIKCRSSFPAATTIGERSALSTSFVRRS
jgi:hypothetical protein